MKERHIQNVKWISKSIPYHTVYYAITTVAHLLSEEGTRLEKKKMGKYDSVKPDLRIEHLYLVQVRITQIFQPESWLNYR